MTRTETHDARPNTAAMAMTAEAYARRTVNSVPGGTIYEDGENEDDPKKSA